MACTRAAPFMSRTLAHNPDGTEAEHPNTPWILTLLCCVVFMAVVNGTMINVGLPFIGRDFGVSEGTYGWMVTGFTLTFGIFSAINGRLGDIFGIKRLYLSGISVFGSASLIVAMAPSIEIAIVVRILQGAGAAAMPVLGSTIVTRIVPSAKRGWAMGIILSTVGVAASIGPFLGGVLVQFLGWRAIFVFTSIVLCAIPIGLKLLPEELNDTDGQHFDVLGAAFLGLAVASLLYSFEIVEESGFTYVLAINLAASATLHGLFWWWIGRAKEPFAPRELIGNIRFQLVAFVAFLSNSTRFGTIVLVPIFLIEVNKLEPVMVGAVLFPGALAIAILSPRSGAVSDKFGPRLPVLGGSIFIVFGNLISASFTGSPIWVGLGMGLYGIGFAFIQTPCTSAISRIVPDRYTGVGLGMFMMIFFMGGAVGTALSITAVELQPLDAASWLPFESIGAAARYSNAMLVLTGLGMLSVLLAWSIPSKAEMAQA